MKTTLISLILLVSFSLSGCALPLSVPLDEETQKTAKKSQSTEELAKPESSVSIYSENPIYYSGEVSTASQENQENPKESVKIKESHWDVTSMENPEFYNN